MDSGNGDPDVSKKHEHGIGAECPHLGLLIPVDKCPEIVFEAPNLVYLGLTCMFIVKTQPPHRLSAVK